MQTSQLKVAVAKNSALERLITTFAKLVSDCDQVDLGVFTHVSTFSTATDDEKARDIYNIASLVNSVYALTPIHPTDSMSEDQMAVSTVIKVKCERCGFLVNPHGHAERCEVKGLTPQWLKTMAWLGDSLLGAHIRVLLVVSAGIDGAKFQMYTSNSRLSVVYEHVPTTFLGDDFAASGLSKESRGTSVEAAYAMSFEYRYRLMEYYDFSNHLDIAFSDLSLSTTIHYMMKTGSLLVSPNRHVFGYCYMCLLPDETSFSVANSLGPFAEYGKIKQYLIGHRVKKKWYITHQFANVYHISLRPVKNVKPVFSYSSEIGLVDSDVLGASLSNDDGASDTESDGGFASLFVKDRNISTMLLSRQLSLVWGDDNVEKFQQAAIVARALIDIGGSRPWVVCVSTLTLSVFEGVFSQPPTTSFDQLSETLDRLISSLVALVGVIQVSRDSSYIASSGIASLSRSRV